MAKIIRKNTRNNSITNVELSPNGKNFILNPPRGLSRHASSLPSSRFIVSMRQWTANAVHMNAKHMWDNPQYYQFSEAVRTKINELLNERMTAKKPFPHNYLFKTKPFAVQMAALNHSFGLESSALFMECGMGKTMTLINLFCAKVMHKQITCAVVFAPPATLQSFHGEFLKHSPLKITPHIIKTSTQASRDKVKKHMNMNKGKPLFFLASIDGLGGLRKDREKRVIDRGNLANIVESIITKRKSLIAIDESQNIINPDSNRSMNAYYLRYRRNNQTLIMTGTPISTNLAGIFGQFYFLDKEIINAKNKGQFNRNFGSGDGMNKLLKIIKPYTFVATKEKWLDLPPKLYQIRHVKMHPEQIKAYNRAKSSSMINFEADEKNIIRSVLHLMHVLQQISGGFVINGENNHQRGEKRKIHQIVPIDQNPKINDLLEFIASTGHKPMLIWAHFIHEQKALYEALSEKYPKKVVWLKGGGNTGKTVKSFTEGDALFVISNVEVGGVGLTLNKAKYSYYFSNHLSPLLRSQSEDRNHRIGQDESVTIIDCVCQNSRDGAILENISNHIQFDAQLKTALENGHKTDNTPLSDEGKIKNHILRGSIRDFVKSL